MPKFIEVVKGFSINIDSIVSVKQSKKGILLIQANSREYTFNADFDKFMDFIQEDDIRKRRMEKMTAQFFGG